MFLQQIKTEGLALFSYILGDERSGECVVIDPRRDVDIFLNITRHNNLRIINIIETHVHADFISGSLALSHHTGAPVSISASAEVDFDHLSLQEDDTIPVGRFQLKVIHTPGHTPEHISLLVSGGIGAEKPWGLFTGDTLFAGEVGRPDLLGEGTEEKLARSLFHTLKEKLLSLKDEIIVYPAHGQGSPCGGNIGDRKTTTIGYEKNNNPVLSIQDEDEFIQAVMNALAPAPAYYSRVKRINTEGAKVYESIPYIKPLSPKEFQECTQEDANTIIVDTRSMEAFGGAHIAGAINIGLHEPFPIWAGKILDEAFPIWAGRMLDPEMAICLVLPDADRLDEVQRHLFRIGYENITGYLNNGMYSWVEAGHSFATIPQLSVHEVRDRINNGDPLQILDVRSAEEWKLGHIPTAKHIYVPDLFDQISKIDRTKPVATYCGTGYRASIAASILKSKGFDVYNIPGSMSAWEAADYETVQPSQ
jgi:hydroxyacylglutathione hydrolase